jgi:hypothetical protein
MRANVKLPWMLLCAALCAGALAGCSSAVSTSSFTGAEHDVAQVIANLQSDATASDQKKICSELLAESVVKSLGGQQGCEQAFKTQLAEIDNLEANVEKVQITSPTTATATVEAIHEGKKSLQPVTLVKERGAWRVSGLQ